MAVNNPFLTCIMTVKEHRQACLSHGVPPGVGFPTWELTVRGLGDANEKRGYRFDSVRPDSFPTLTEAGEQSVFTNNPYKIPLPDPNNITQEMLNTMPIPVMTRLTFKHNSGATHALFETKKENEGLNLLVEVVARLPKNATTLDTAIAFGYSERTLVKYKLAYEAMLKELIQGSQGGQADLFGVGGTKKPTPGPGARVQGATNTAARGRHGKNDQKGRVVKKRTAKVVIPKNNQGSPWAVARKPGTTGTTWGSHKVVTRRDKRAAALSTKGGKVFTSKSRDGTKVSR
jgi:hypothetical protein